VHKSFFDKRFAHSPQGDIRMPRRHGATLSHDQNLLLGRLRPADLRAFMDRGDLVELEFGQILAEPDRPLGHVYFPSTGFISLMVPADGHTALEVGLAGREGMFGATLLLGIDLAPMHALVQGSGSALRMTTSRFLKEVDARPALRATLLRYCYVVHRQLGQTAACTHFHSVETRLARWLLMTQDRADGAPLQLTQEFLARMLGARRVGITHAAGALQARKLIVYHRGEVVVVNRRGLEAASCRCYGEDRRLYERSLGVAA
jgi:CRP-like cAMP-binding protein